MNGKNPARRNRQRKSSRYLSRTSQSTNNQLTIASLFELRPNSAGNKRPFSFSFCAFLMRKIFIDEKFIQEKIMKILHVQSSRPIGAMTFAVAPKKPARVASRHVGNHCAGFPRKATRLDSNHHNPQNSVVEFRSRWPSHFSLSMFLLGYSVLWTL